MELLRSYTARRLFVPYCSAAIGTNVMQAKDVLGRYERLKRELAEAYAERPWQPGRIDRLAAEIVAVERLLTTSQSNFHRQAEAIS